MKKNVLFFTNLKSFMLIATFFSLWFAVYFQDNIEDIFAYILILSLGILHGTNDIKLIQKASELSNSSQKTKLYKILISYSSIVTLSILSFYFVPVFALFLFIFFSAYHFGEQHWSSKIYNKSFTSRIMYTTYGLIILFMLFFNNSQEVTIIINNITGISFTKNLYLYILIFSSICFLIISIKENIYAKIKSNPLEEVFYLFLFFIVFHTASLLWAFAIYFIFWHSIPSLADQVYYLYGDYKKKNFYKYLKSSFPYWLISIIGLSILYFVFDDQNHLFLSIFFILIAAITFPHVLVMAKFKKQ
ncbi:Brp/Blh family beta-carotene 15,15'-dioxygenase [Aquimarina sp. MMG016]|uniref:Brp/Blh family beta-carotene 15,15'-dioxygenase n=1 Tax=Aquimarina sp. MMG016 TaxID=2822690 RepID=UPI001B3A6371|nr:Brp/Blh family beta-carotene 15,15'-dioxygenase [Aquimarina sp. MMG016]MBQ4821240.1 Brp/Blh family beta-carotene 15,15'-dioxygenase [Aquimarina sp. MMG016]